MSVIGVETRVEYQLSILTTITECHQTLAQKVLIPNYIKIGPRVLKSARTDAVKLPDAFFGNFFYFQTHQEVSKSEPITNNAAGPDRRTNNVQPMDRCRQ